MITFDSGAEFVEQSKLIQISSYFTLLQRGRVEVISVNRLLRKFFHKEHSLRQITTEEVQKAEKALNKIISIDSF